MKYKIAIVDDEPIIRASLTQTIPWSEHNCDVCYEADNAIQAMAAFEIHRPDIILLDIHMPGMDGLSIIDKLHEITRDFKVIIISAYQEFNYVKKALQLGVFDYVTKPIRNDEVILVVKKAIHELEIERENSRIKQLEKIENNMLNKYLEDTKQLVQSQALTELIKGHMTLESLSGTLFDFPKDSDKHATIVVKTNCSSEDMGVIKRNILSFLGTIKDKLNYKIMQCIVDRDIVIVIFFNRNTSARDFKVGAKRLSSALLSFMQEWASVQIFIGISNLYQGVNNINISYKEANNTAENQFFARQKNLIFTDDQDKGNYQVKFSMISELEFFYQALNQLDETTIEAQINQIMGKISSYADGNIFAAKSLLTEICITVARSIYNSNLLTEEIPLSELFENIRHIQNFEEGHELIHLVVKQLIESKRSTGNYSHSISSAINYIKRHYMEDISLERVSEEVAMNSSYLSRALKKETGKNFVDIVLEERMLVGKQLLSNPKLKVNQIAVQIGYKDYSYFYQVFKKYTGMTPMEYRKMSKNI